jgi:hypothetical protein
MRILSPTTVDSANLTLTNVSEATPAWVIGTYTVGQQRVYGESVYEALGTTDDRPDIGASLSSPTWLRLGYSNVWRMFRDGADSVSSRSGDIDITIQTVSAVTAVALLGLSGFSARVIITDDTEGVIYDQTKSLVDIGVSNWWDYWFTEYYTVSSVYFSDIPPYAGATMRVVISGATTTSNVECGRVVFGPVREIGVTVEGVQSRLEDFSTKARDEFGGLTLVQRRTIRIVDYDIIVEPGAVDFVQRTFSVFAASPVLFVGHPELPETVVFGVYESFQVVINGHMVSDCSISVQEF